MRLDIHLTQKYPQRTRTHWQRMIQKGLVQVSGQVVSKPRFLIEGEPVIEISPECLQESSIIPENIPLDIVYEDDDLLVVCKPAGMVVHPAYGHQSGTLVNALLFYCKDLSGIGGVKRPGIVHRLDRDTSGLMVVAKNDATHTALSAQFHPDSKVACRSYCAIVHGVPQKMEGRLELPMRKNPRYFDKMQVHFGPNSKPAVTSYKVLSVFGDTTLCLGERYSSIECTLETGRTHQIRVHMAYMKNPILGDTLYGSNREKVDRLMLHARKLSFTHPTTQKPLVFVREAKFANVTNLFEKKETSSQSS